jgi:hypothetical protein
MALLVVGVAVLLGAGLMAQQSQTSERLAAGDEALRAIEASLETLRAGALPLHSGVLQSPAAYPGSAAPEELLLMLDVKTVEPDGLFEVTIEARFRVGRGMHRRRVRTLVWRPL